MFSAAELGGVISVPVAMLGLNQWIHKMNEQTLAFIFQPKLFGHAPKENRIAHQW
jgi:hypothetical protein